MNEHRKPWVFEAGVFTPEMIKILTAAFDGAWERLTSSNAPWTQPDYAEAARILIAKHIIAAAKAGEADLPTLMEGALVHLAKQKMTRSPFV